MLYKSSSDILYNEPPLAGSLGSSWIASSCEQPIVRKKLIRKAQVSEKMADGVSRGERGGKRRSSCW